MAESYVVVHPESYLNDIALGHFVTKIIEAKRINKEACKKHRIYISKDAFEMTPNEELHAKFFNHEIVLVKDMSNVELDAHLEELRLVILEARARYSAADTERNKRSNKGGIKGFERSVATDVTTSEAINAIENRNKRLSKADKVRKSLEALGLPAEEIEKMMSARNIRDSVASNGGAKTEIIKSPFSTSISSPAPSVEATAATEKPASDSNVIKSPFAK